MEELRAHASDWTQNIQNMSVDFRIAGKLDDPFKRTRRKRRHKRHRRSGSQGGSGEGGSDGRGENESESGSYSASSDDSDSSSETHSDVTKTERVPEGESAKELEKEKEEKVSIKDPTISQPLDYFGENLAYIDESSDAVSGKVHLDPFVDKSESNPTSNDRPKRRRQRRHWRRDLQKPKTTKISPDEARISENVAPNGDVHKKDPSPLQPKL